MTLTMGDLLLSIDRRNRTRGGARAYALLCDGVDATGRGSFDEFYVLDDPSACRSPR